MSRAKKRLNSEFVEKMTPDLLKEIDPKDEVIGWLKEMAKYYTVSLMILQSTGQFVDVISLSCAPIDAINHTQPIQQQIRRDFVQHIR